MYTRGPESIAQSPEDSLTIYVRIVMPVLCFKNKVVSDWMDVQTITSLIGSLGFPIAACIACFSMLNKEREEHKQEMQKVTEAIVNNTMALEALKGKLDGN